MNIILLMSLYVMTAFRHFLGGIKRIEDDEVDEGRIKIRAV